jgi:hypothetical protein
MLLLVLVILVPFAALSALAYWYVGRSARPAVSPDLRRADDAQLEEMPTSDEVQERIADAFGETRPIP